MSDLYGKWQLAETPPQKDEKVQFLVLVSQDGEFGECYMLDGRFDGKLFWWKTPFDEKFFRPKNVIVWRKILY